MDPAIARSGVPLLGICYGMQLLALERGAELVKLDRAEYGPATLRVLDPPSPLFTGVPSASRVWMSHGDSVVASPPELRAIAATDRCEIAVMGDDALKMYGVQFHPEVVHTEHGRTILDNFVHRGWRILEGLG